MDANLKNRDQHSLAVNSAWLIGDKVVRLGLNLIITIWLARHFGPEGFGVWNFASAFVALFGVFAVLGMDGIIVRELVTRSEEHTSELQSLMRISYAVFCLKKKIKE